MDSRAKLATILIAVASLGCIGMPQQLAVSPADNQLPDVPTNTEKRMIKDPVVGGMDAIEITIPAKWHFEGDMYLMSEGGSALGDSCSSSPTGVFRATSPDGLSFMEELPSPAWGWAKGPDAELFGVKNCFPLQGPTSAQEMLKYIAATLGVEYLRDEPVPQERTAKVQKKVDDSNAPYANLNRSSKYSTLHLTSELAWAEVRSKNGTFTMKGRLRAQVSCTERVNPPLASMTDHKKKEPTTVDTCQALLLYEAAPESQYPALAEEWDSPARDRVF
jgi:hypothetical protein